jgi:PAS domain S-box-containing protein
MDTPFENEVAKRFGLLPNFFRLAAADPKIGPNLWGFAQFAYLDNPLPSLFKERLFVYLSRFCDVRYCIARHLGFLIGMGYPAGDSSCLPQTVESVLPLLRRSLPHGDGMLPLFAVCAGFQSPLSTFPVSDSLGEQALFSCATHVFLQTGDASSSHEALRRALGVANLEQLNLLLAFVRTAHYWTKLHPELTFENDVDQLLATHEVLAQRILNDPEAQSDHLSRQVAEELTSLQKLREQHESMAEAYQGLSIDHQHMKHSLHETEEKLRELIAVMPAAVYACDRDGIITYYNRQAGELWGCAPQLDSRRIYHMDGTPLPAGESPIKQVLSAGVPIVNGEFALERPDHSRISVLANIAALRDSASAIVGAVSIFQDITELKRIQQEREELLHELERSNRELSQFSYNVSHDLQAPVRNVRALTQLLARRAGSPQEDSSQLLMLIEQSAIGMERLIDSLLQYAQAGQGQLNRQCVNVGEIIESVRMTLASAIAKTGAQISCGPLPMVEADPVLLEHLLQNLVANAIKYHRPDEAPRVEISGEPSKDGWHFSVRDNGQGIPRTDQEVIFEPLKRLHGGETPGTGLGLALCRTIVARHGGRIWVESEGSGYGAIFRFTLLPASPAKAAVDETKQAHAAWETHLTEQNAMRS